MNDKDKIEQLEKKIDEMQREFTKFKNDLNTEMVKQQGNTREPIRSDRGQIILKKNAEITSRRGLSGNSAGIERVLSMYFNEAASDGLNAIYLGSDGGNQKRNVSQIANTVSYKDDEEASFAVFVDKVNEDGFRVDENGNLVDFSVKLPNVRIIANKQGSLLSSPSEEGSFSGLGNWVNSVGSTLPVLYVTEQEVAMQFLPGKTINVVTLDSNFNTTSIKQGVTYSGSVGSIEVTNGIVTNVTPPAPSL